MWCDDCNANFVEYMAWLHWLSVAIEGLVPHCAFAINTH